MTRPLLVFEKSPTTSNFCFNDFFSHISQLSVRHKHPWKRKQPNIHQKKIPTLSENKKYKVTVNFCTKELETSSILFLDLQGIILVKIVSPLSKMSHVSIHQQILIYKFKVQVFYIFRITMKDTFLIHNYQHKFFLEALSLFRLIASCL